MSRKRLVFGHLSRFVWPYLHSKNSSFLAPGITQVLYLQYILEFVPTILVSLTWFAGLSFSKITSFPRKRESRSSAGADPRFCIRGLYADIRKNREAT
jgi:hypothetical protein